MHWNDDLYDSYEEATRREDGIVIIAVFVKVSRRFFIIIHSTFQNVPFNFFITFALYVGLLILMISLMFNFTSSCIILSILQKCMV